MSTPNRQEAIRLSVAVARDTGLGLILERHAFDLTWCPDCEQDEFVHADGCTLAERVEELCAWLKNPVGEKPWELDTIVVMKR